MWSKRYVKASQTFRQDQSFKRFLLSEVKKAIVSSQARQRVPSLWKVISIKLINFFLIKIWGKVVQTVAKLYVNKPDARNPLDFSLSRTSVEVLIDQIQFFADLSYTFAQYLIT